MKSYFLNSTDILVLKGIILFINTSLILIKINKKYFFLFNFSLQTLCLYLSKKINKIFYILKIYYFNSIINIINEGN
jgi:hypothetical protein